MKKNNKVSIIVPIYKVEKYLRKCIESILNQTYENFELILVDDGSPDNCGSICDEYASKDNRIIVIHKENGGLSDARNFGINKASGEWIAFIDSDDYIKDDYIEKLVNICGDDCEIGIVLPSYVYEDYKEKKDNKREFIKIFDSKDALLTMLYQKEFDTSAWGKIYKRNLFSQIEFPVGKLYEDISTIYRVILKSNKVAYCNCKKYMYLQRKDSIMGNSFKIKDMDYVYQAEIMMNDLLRFNDKMLEKAAKCRYINANFSILLKIRKSKQYMAQRKEILENIKKFRKKVIFDKSVRLKTRIALFLTLFNVL